MARRFVQCTLILSFLAGVMAWNAAVPRAQEPPPKEKTPPAKPRAEHPAVAIARKMSQKADFPGYDDPKTNLAEALDNLSTRYGVSFEINDKAFKADQINEVEKVEIAQPTPIQAMKQAPLERVLRKILARIPATSEACVVVRKDHLEITTGAARLAEFWPNGNENVRPNPDATDPATTTPRPLPLVVMEFDRVPLDEALRELAGATGYSIVLDARAGEKGKTPVTGSLINVPLDTAVRMIADMADLKPVLLNSAIYVTTENRADRFQPGSPFPVPGAPGAMGALQPGAGQIGALGALGIGGGFGQVGGVQPSPFAQAASVHVERKPLAAVLRELTEGRKVYLLFDAERIGQRDSRPVTAALERVSLQTCIRLLTDMADLATVFIDNVAYVTSRENARRFLEEAAEKALTGSAASQPAEKK